VGARVFYANRRRALCNALSRSLGVFAPKPRKFVMCERGDLCKLTAVVLSVHSIIATAAVRRFASTPRPQLTRVKYSRFAHSAFSAHSLAVYTGEAALERK
jgi:hypothetical protein